jgi:hypothetical protein
MNHWKSVTLLIFAVVVWSFSVYADENNGNVRDVFKSNISPPDPSGPVSAGQPVAIQADLQGISIGSKGAFAIINSQLYREGEEKQGIKVTKIRKREVDIIVNGMASTLRMVVGQGTEPSAPSQGAETQGPVGLDQISKAPVGLSGSSEGEQL